MTIYSERQRKNIVTIILLLTFIFILYLSRDIFTGIFGAVLLYTLFKPLYKFLSEKKRWNKSLSALAVIFISFFIIVLPFSFLSLMIVNKIIYFSDHPEHITNLIDRINHTLGATIKDADMVNGIIKKGEGWIVGLFSSVVGSVVNSVVQLLIMYFILYFMLTNYKRFESGLLQFLPFKPHTARLFAKDLKNITYSNILGQGIIAVVQGTLVGVGFFIFKLNDPVFWGVLCIFLSFIPVIGSTFINIPAGIIAISSGNVFGGVGILIWGLVLVSAIDNVIRLLIAKWIANVHPLITILGIILGIPFFGILGLVAGPLLLSYFILLVKVYKDTYVKHEDPENDKLPKVS